MIPSPETIAFLMAAALVAGCIDAMAGGGGLIALPALMAAGIPPVAAVATNKLQSSLGTFGACVAYARAGHMDLKTYRWPIFAAFAGSVGGAWLVQRVDPSILAGLMPALLIALAAYFTFSPKVGEMNRHQRVGMLFLSLLIGIIGFYDGFFGPGAGAFYTTIFIALGGLGLVRATAQTKAANFASNLAGLLTMIVGGHVIWIVGLAMAVGSITGGQIGSRLAMRFGSRLIRPLLIILSLALTAKMLLDPKNPIHSLLFG
ncbi:TSUP family transporter [Sphingobium chlorophenolicum]|uniref:Probable membrane transporter protein n=1 Tax=Sphingobium chlorophenolicum TaxID=46429 RepID=A0A081RJ46_SPHCR|nr:TSUP family transporter [Sphingobium chlorophenolicum]KEQ55219.1 Membrane protein [Sphingobium chlorophenolicum]